MNPFREFCVTLFGEEFTASQVGDNLGVSRDTVRAWLKRETMPAAISIEVLRRRMQHAVDLCEGVYERLDEEDRKAVDEITEEHLGNLESVRIARIRDGMESF